MTEEELQMMDTIYLYGLIYSMDEDTKSIVLNRLARILKDGQQGPEPMERITG